jgi:hypothetical protein
MCQLSISGETITILKSLNSSAKTSLTLANWHIG